MQPQYPPQHYPPQYPVDPNATQTQYPPQYAPAAPQHYPPQQYYAPPPPPPPPVVTGSLTDFYGAPSTASKAWVFRDKPIGTSYSGIVARVVGNGDVRQQTDQGGRPQTYKDGRPKWVMIVPMMVQPSPEYPEGQASWWVKGQARDELARAMAEAGAPEGPPEAGAGITVTLIGQRPIPGMNPAFQYRIQYLRPGGAAPAPQPMAPTYTPPPQVPTPEPQYVAPPQPVYAQPAPPQAPAPMAPAGQFAGSAALNAEQQALLLKLTGQPTG